MKLTSRCAAALAILAACFLAVPRPAAAQVELSEKEFQPGVNFAAFFELKHGCGTSPTISLRVEIPDGVSIVQTPPMPGWMVSVEPRPLAVTWRGKLAANKPEHFGLLIKLPMKSGALYFPATQRCESGEVRWTDTPVSGRTAPAHPAPALLLGPAGDMSAMANMPGMSGKPVPAQETAPVISTVTISDAWIRALPGGVPAGGYFRAHNGGAAPVTMTSAESPSCGMLMLHKTMKMAGMADMEEMTRVDIPPSRDVLFEPGGYHLMCTKPSASVKPGGTVRVTFFFANGAKADAEFAVRDAKGN